MGVAPEVIRTRLEFWRKELGYDNWFFLVFTDSPHPDGYRGTCGPVQREYRVATFRFDPEKIEDWELDGIIVHEMAAHITTWPWAAVAEIAAGRDKKLKHMVEVANEAMTSDIERLILRLKGLPYGGTIEGVK
jgi:hypothetical protein